MDNDRDIKVPCNCELPVENGKLFFKGRIPRIGIIDTDFTDADNFFITQEFVKVTFPAVSELLNIKC